MAPKTRIESVIVDRSQQDKELARIEGVLWPPAASPVRLPESHRIGFVRDVSLTLTAKTALVVIDVETGLE